jgi:hypothetical protein
VENLATAMKKVLLILFLIVLFSPRSANAIVPATSSSSLSPTGSPLQSRIVKLHAYEEGFQKMDEIQIRITSRLGKMKALSLKTSKAETDMIKLRSDLEQTHESMKKLNSELVFSTGTLTEIRAHDLALKTISKKLLSALATEKTIVTSLKKLTPLTTPIISTSSGGIQL